MNFSEMPNFIAHVPLIGIDIWEHAFYLQYLNVKVDVRISFTSSVAGIPNTVFLFLQYLNAIWNVINFEEAEKRYLEAVGGAKL